jgi:hypothetical protein
MSVAEVSFRDGASVDGIVKLALVKYRNSSEVLTPITLTLTNGCRTLLLVNDLGVVKHI